MTPVIDPQAKACGSETRMADQHVSNCPACTRLGAIRTDPLFITELRESVVVLHAHQPVEGWCVLLLKDHAEHLHELSLERQQRLWADVGDVARAVDAAFSPRRINYECLGNVMAHVHWHVIPRYLPPVDPEPGATVWVRPASWLDCGVEADRARAVIARIREAVNSQQ